MFQYHLLFCYEADCRMLVKQLSFHLCHQETKCGYLTQIGPCVSGTLEQELRDCPQLIKASSETERVRPGPKPIPDPGHMNIKGLGGTARTRVTFHTSLSLRESLLTVHCLV